MNVEFRSTANKGRTHCFIPFIQDRTTVSIYATKSSAERQVNGSNSNGGFSANQPVPKTPLTFRAIIAEV
ncbi:hypothetical protein NC653_035289 [Populus alba x Populus x berolinensis]|uniref:Uncharacterized protein n=1 Tax=Populus alba x Populus x berolinensis TaxID=444605 RepID=A0AAD6PX35_9ROSI|nr:hypothetical protein NC653_035289 [Populus alba x Populus x berolinensis]